MNSAILHLEKKGIPNQFRFLLIWVVLIALFTPFFAGNQNLVHGLLLSLHPLIFLGIYSGFFSHKEIKFPRVVFTAGVLLFATSISLNILIYFKIPIPQNFVLLIEQTGIILFTFFAYIHIYLLEKKFNIKGFAIDYTLLIISALFLVLLISPNLLHILINELTFNQQLLAFNFFMGMTVLTMSLIHYFLTKSIELTDGVRILLTILIVIHFGLEMLLSLVELKNAVLIYTISLSLIHITGAVCVLFIFIEDLALNHSAITPTRVGNFFMWVSSIFAIIAIPLGLVIRSTLDAPDLDLFVIGMTSIIVSSVVIWRLTVIIRNSNQHKDRLNSLIKTNTLTGLPNYQGYLEQLTFTDLKNILVVHINIEDFKSINDLYGRDAGDEVLISLGHRLQQLPNSLLAAHIQSDQFLVAFRANEADLPALIKTIQKDLGIWDTLQGKSIAVPLTMGASFSETLEPERLAKRAEIALKQARKQHSSFAFFTEDRLQNRIPRHELRQILQKSVDDGFLPIHFQPIYSIDDGSLKALELLIRVDSKEHGLLLPSQFLEQAKSYALLTSLTEICIKMIARNSKELGDIVVNINLPPYMLKSTKLLNNFIQSFEDEKLEPERFCIEITEDEEISAHELIPAIQVLKEKGFSIAMDDFGSGYSSLDRLSILDVDTVKIDRSILLSSESGNTTILEWAISLAKRIGVIVVVEGVETLEQLSLVKRLGADSVQGFLYSKPVSAIEIKNIALNSNDIKIN